MLYVVGRLSEHDQRQAGSVNKSIDSLQVVVAT